MVLKDKLNKYKSMLAEQEVLRQEIKDEFVALYIKQSGIKVGDEYESIGGVKGMITRIDASVFGKISVYWRKRKKDGELYANECECYALSEILEV